MARRTRAIQTQTLRVVGVVAVVGSFETLTGRGFPNIVGVTPAFFRGPSGPYAD